MANDEYQCSLSRQIKPLLSDIFCSRKNISLILTRFTCSTVHTTTTGSRRRYSGKFTAFWLFSVTRHHARMESGWQPGVQGPAAVTDGAFRGRSVPRWVDHNLVTLKGTLQGWQIF